VPRLSVLETLAPLALLIGLGVGLARVRFLGAAFMADLNKLAFWVALPALLFRSAMGARHPSAQIWTLVAVLIGATLFIALVAWGATYALGLPTSGRGTLVQAAFRGNLAFIGIPVVAYSLAPADAGILATAVIAMTLTMAFYNALAVVVLQASRPRTGRIAVAPTVRSVATNPLLLSGLSGLLVAAAGLQLPSFLDRTLETLGGAAVPIALLCVGGSLATTRLTGRRSWIGTAALLKIAVLPLVVFALARLTGLSPGEQRIALVFSAAPTAASSYIMARQMDGDETLAAGAVALSTVLSTVSLAAALWLTT
jgi:hypothetical protein